VKCVGQLQLFRRLMFTICVQNLRKKSLVCVVLELIVIINLICSVLEVSQTSMTWRVVGYSERNKGYKPGNSQHNGNIGMDCVCIPKLKVMSQRPTV